MKSVVHFLEEQIEIYFKRLTASQEEQDEKRVEIDKAGNTIISSHMTLNGCFNFQNYNLSYSTNHRTL